MKKIDFRNSIAHNFRLVHNGIDKLFTNNRLDCDDIKLTHAQCGMMNYIYDHREFDVFQKDMEDCFQISGATASNTLKGMEKQGVIVRVPMEDDARKKKITLTQKGVAFHEAALMNMRRLEEALTKGMTEEEITIYRDLLRRSIQNLDEMGE